MINHRIWNIRYVKLHFLLEMTEDTVLPINKTSAIRGGMGEMLLRENCIRNRDCVNCDFVSECIVQRTMYSQMEIRPDFMSSGDSVGYVIECEDYRDRMRRGDTLAFNLILFGKTIVYFSQYLRAVFMLGQQGIGKNAGHFVIRSVTNTRKEPILKGSEVMMERYQVTTLGEYIACRNRQLGKETYENRFVPETLLIKLKSPTLIKYQGAFLKEINLEAFLTALARRIFILDCFEGIDEPQIDLSQRELPGILRQEHREVQVPRFSNRSQEKTIMRGIEGEFEMTLPGEELLWLLLAGELVHVGKNTSFGFGRYRVTFEPAV